MKACSIRLLIGLVFGTISSILFIWLFDIESGKAIAAYVLLCATVFGLASAFISAKRIEKIVKFVVTLLNP
jgi:hypothetical protein